ncbi:hypothetical protein [Singulisphaera acidiphila]|uniref:Uncharacterized protein n=1 Tax=Singulisphaera acidiphila (strain ATCC BAA-1392 / DSM 18658 / VKM B-2454 / MOB10) TaxID=886293 RepID=L0DGS8_SINAD|nr:hypothetical protein [Singulisphaera acidiphila]AGA28467.1 hypothetical protein Sinac_4268 [Singulisphaera acidiphila DSM 18658]
MEAKEPLPGPGCFQWNRGGWFGGQLGSTVWMLVGGVVLVPYALDVACVWLACFAVANAIGAWLWRGRDRLPPYPALQALLATCGVSSLVALAALHILRPGLRITRPPGIWLADEPQYLPWVLVLFLAVMTSCSLRERSARRQVLRSKGPSTP